MSTLTYTGSVFLVANGKESCLAFKECSPRERKEYEQNPVFFDTEYMNFCGKMYESSKDIVFDIELMNSRVEKHPCGLLHPLDGIIQVECETLIDNNNVPEKSTIEKYDVHIADIDTFRDEIRKISSNRFYWE